MMGTSGKNKKFDFLEYLRQISKYRITSISAVPPILVALAKLPPAVLSQIDLSCVKYVTCGSAPLSADIRKSVESLLTKQQPPGQSVCVKQGWGMTE
jgi:4-coumarate--CoA ligase